MRKSRVADWFILLGVLALVLVGVDKMGWDSWIKGIIERPVVVVKQGVFSSWRRMAGVRIDLGSGKTGVVDDPALVLKVNQLMGEVATLSAENAALRSQVGVAPRVSGKLIMGSPIGEAPGRLTINVGGSEGVTVGDSVIVGDVLVGRVIGLSAQQSDVLLPTYEGERVAAAVRSGGVDGVKRASGIVVGQGGQLILEKVVLAEPLSVGDLVMTVGEGYKRDLVVGRVAEILAQSDQLFKRARVEPAVEYSNLDRVFVVID